MPRNPQQEIKRLVKTSTVLVKDVTELRGLVDEYAENPIIGPAGSDGTDGQAGAAGDPGERGERGSQGLVGPPGDDGERGLDGRDGLQGLEGRDGVNGTDGATGMDGAEGDPGAAGRVGPKGDKGDKGAKGDHGTKGEKGPKGASVTGAHIKGSDLIIEIDGRPKNAGPIIPRITVGGGGGSGGGGSSAMIRQLAGASIPTVKLKGEKYAKGFYEFASVPSDFVIAVPWGNENVSYAARVGFIVEAGGAGGVDTVVSVTGTRIEDAGTRTPNYTAQVTFAHDGVSGAYYETNEKFLGEQVVAHVSGPALSANYGWTAYWDAGNTDFTIVGAEGEWNANAVDTAFNVELLHHKATGWTYNAVGQPTPPTPIASLNTLHGVESDLGAAEHGRMKPVPLSTDVMGSANEGVLWKVTTSVNNSLNYGTLEFWFTQIGV